MKDFRMSLKTYNRLLKCHDGFSNLRVTGELQASMNACVFFLKYMNNRKLELNSIKSFIKSFIHPYERWILG